MNPASSRIAAANDEIEKLYDRLVKWCCLLFFGMQQYPSIAEFLQLLLFGVGS